MDQATNFNTTMKEIWGSNANQMASALGAKETGQVSDDKEDNPFVEWEFPDGSKTWIGRKGDKLEVIKSIKQFEKKRLECAQQAF